jgi:hypothetical protein
MGLAFLAGPNGVESVIDYSNSGQVPGIYSGLDSVELRNIFAFNKDSMQIVLFVLSSSTNALCILCLYRRAP